MPFRVSPEAERDLDEIFLYWAERAGLKIADRVIGAITDRFWVLGEHPGVGKLAPDTSPGVRGFPAGKYIVYYRNTRNGIEILHIFHGAREQRRAFRSKRGKRREPT